MAREMPDVLDGRLADWYVGIAEREVKTVGLFQAKTKLSEICEAVARSGEAVVITRRGVPFVRIDPLPGERRSIWDDRKRYVSRRRRLRDEFDLPPRSGDLPGELGV
jgi:antitoxin (DNA-binding transcriptional repressor) of toxin-antitoxin stability system